MKLLRATILAAAVTFGLPVWANECEGWNTDGFFKAVSANDVTSCLSAGADVNARTKDGWTPLHLAAPEQIIADAVGHAPTQKPLMDYLERKFTDLYDL